MIPYLDQTPQSFYLRMIWIEHYGPGCFEDVVKEEFFNVSRRKRIRLDPDCPLREWPRFSHRVGPFTSRQSAFSCF